MFLLIGFCLYPFFAHAGENFWQRETLTGDWTGGRSKLSDKGLDLEFVYTGDVFSNVAGGVQRQTDYVGNFDMVLSVDAEKLMGWHGGSFYFYGFGNHGGSPSANSGDVQGVNNIEAPGAFRLGEAWFQQILFDDKFSFLLGIYDANSEFDAMETAALFINSSHGMGPDLSQSGQNSPSVWPNTSLGVRMKFEPKPWLYAQFAVLDGVPNDPTDVYGNEIRLSGSEGLLLLSEIGFLPAEKNEGWPYARFSLGGWYYTARFDDLLDTDVTGAAVQRRTNFGFYGIAEYQVLREKNAPEQGLNLFLRAGYASPAINPLVAYVGAGAVYTGLFAGRDEDQMGIAVATAMNGSKFKNAQSAAGTPVESAEIDIELTYRAQVTPWLAVQPDLQYVINPGMAPGVGNALQAGVRMEIIF